MKRFLLCLSAILAVMILPAEEAKSEESWQVTCGDNNNPTTCRMVQNLYLRQKAENGQEKSGRVLSVTVLYAVNQQSGKREPHMSLQLPLGVDLPAGVVYRVDQGEETSLKYLTCTQRGCETAFPISEKALEAMLDGKELQVGFRGWGAKQTSVVKVTLIGFTRAFSALG